ncbi:MAG TPA: MarR family winged helix-turn-helix transcriptional regulator [Candidatus Methylomirabilis sp.]|nr:MarR family winged helix-turn-helix transcriptional regulator [Candidatus Methylomirabilis sp.]
MVKPGGGSARERLGKLAEEGAKCLCFNVRKAARAVTQLYDERMRASGLRVTQLSILAVTMKLGPLTVSRLAKATVTDRTTLTRNLQLLERQGFIGVSRGGDRREREVALTGRGRAALAQAYPLWKEVQDRVARDVGRERLEGLLSDLAAVVEATRSA